MTTGVIDQDPAHDLRRDTKEMRSILPIDLALVDEPDVRLMNEGRRLQGVVGPLAPKLARGNAAKLRIDEWQQLVERSPVAATPIAEQRRDVARRHHRSLSISGDREAQHSTGKSGSKAFVPLTRYGRRLRDLHTGNPNRRGNI